MTQLLTGWKCTKCFWAVSVSVSQEDAETLISIFKVKDGVKQHRMWMRDPMGRSGESRSIKSIPGKTWTAGKAGTGHGRWGG